MENYTIYDEIGRGTHSFVYKARRKRSIEYVAVKSTAKTRMDKVRAMWTVGILKATPSFRVLLIPCRQILNEVQILHKLDSRHVLKFFNWYESQNHIWLIFEYCIGGDLLKIITQDRRLPAPTVQAFGAELVAGLFYLHANGILFCDLKPANILIDECGALKLADFGLARRIPTAESLAGNTMASGSPIYMAPELFQPLAIHSFASDFWALGCVLYELCTGGPPFTNTFFPELARIIQTEQLVIPHEGYQISPPFADLMQRLLEKDPYQRITWPELISHPFWNNGLALDVNSIPLQALFEASRPRSHELRAESQSVAIQEHHELALLPSIGGSEIQEKSSTESTSSSGGRPSEQPNENEGMIHDMQHDDELDAGREDSGTDDDEEEEEDDDDNSTDGEDESEVVREKIRPITAPPRIEAPKPRADHPADRSALEVARAQEKGEASRTRTAPSGGRRGRHNQSSLQSRASRQVSIVKASRLLFVAADSIVKPVAFSDEIEVIPTLRPRPELLEFEAISAEDLLSRPTEELEDHLKSIYINLKSAELNVSEKKNVLAHLFQLSLLPKLANVIVNSSLLTLLIKTLRQCQSLTSAAGHANQDLSCLVPTVTLVLGVLFRFATFISPTSPEHIHALLVSLTNFVDERCGSVSPDDFEAKRRAMACLGELLFYLATQQNSSLPQTGMQSLVKTLDDEDYVTRHYALRTIANMLTLGVDERIQDGLMNEATGVALVRCLVVIPTRSGSPILFKTTATQALAQCCRLLRFSPERMRISTRTKTAIMIAISKPSVLAILWEGVATGQAAPELAIASLNVINTYLESSIDRDIDEDAHASVTKHRHLLLESHVNIDVILRLLEVRSRYEEDGKLYSSVNSGPNRRESVTGEPARRYVEGDTALPTLLRAKMILFIHFGILRSMKFARLCVRSSVVDKIEVSLSPFASKLRAQLSSPGPSKKTKPDDPSLGQLPALDQYVLQCGQNVIRVCIRTALKMSAECISSSNAIAYEVDGNVDGQPYTSLIASEPFQLFEQLIKNPTCRTQLSYFFLVNEGKEFRFFIRLMSKLLTSFSTETLAAMGTTVGAVISKLILRLFQNTSSDAGALVSTEPIELFTHLLPAVVVQLLRPREQDQVGVGEEEEDDHSVNCIQLVYLVMLHLEYDLNANESSERDHFVTNHLLPCFQVLFGPARQNENVWRFSVELLYGLMARDPQSVSSFASNGLEGPILALLSSPRLHGYRSMPSSATALVKEMVEVKRKANDLGSLYLLQITRHLSEGIDFAVNASTYNAGTAHLLEVLYVLLHHRYEERRRPGDEGAPPQFDEFVKCGPLLLRLCAQAAPIRAEEDQPQHSPTTKTDEPDHPSVVHVKVLDAASRCLIFLSQIFGAELNDVLFGKASSAVNKEAIARSLLSCLHSRHERMLLHILLTIKNSLRCDKKSVTPYARRWLESDRAAMAEIQRISKRPRASPSMNRDRAAQEQIVKTASEIVTFFQTTQTAQPSSSANHIQRGKMR